MAQAHGKPVGIGETGIAVGDNTDLAGTIASDFNAPGAPQLAFVNVWDVTTGEGDWQFTNGHNPAAASAWAAAFAGSSGSTTPTSAPVSAPAAASAPAASSTDTSASTAISAQSVSTYNGSVIFLNPDGNRAEAAWGPMDVAGDAGADLYVVHPGDAALTVENFSAGKGDILNISPSLQSVFSQTQVSGGDLVSFANDPSHTDSVFLKGVDTVDPSTIVWS